MHCWLGTRVFAPGHKRAFGLAGAVATLRPKADTDVKRTSDRYQHWWWFDSVSLTGGLCQESEAVPERNFCVGAQGRNRTTDTCIFSAVLYRLSYLGLLFGL